MEHAAWHKMLIPLYCTDLTLYIAVINIWQSK